MELKQFAETYAKLEKKAYEIMKIYNLSNYGLDGIEVEEIDGKLWLNIKTSFYYSGCGTESEWLSFELEEMNNDLDYFKTKRENELKQKEIDKKLKEQKEKEDRKKRKEARDKLEFERLKKKYETNS